MSAASGLACLVVADESAEFPAALSYASRLAKGAGWRLIMLRVIEPAEPAPWASVTDEIRRQAHAAAESLTQRFAAEVWAESGITAERIIREGDIRPEIRRLMDDDAGIQLLILAAAHGAGGPGPLVASLAKGQNFGARPAPVIVVPGGLSKDDARALALPVRTDEPAPGGPVR